MEESLIFALIIGIGSAKLCATQAGSLNRNKLVWGILGFLFPLITILIVLSIKPKVNENTNSATGEE